MYHISGKSWNRIITILIFLFSLLFIVQACINYFLIRFTTLDSIKNKNNKLIQRIENDLKYENGKWDTSLYNSDPLTPHPDGSSGFSQPLYILTNDGFVLERTLPINGFLDSSSLKDILVYTSPQSIISQTGEEWRVFAKPINSNGQTIGGIIVSRYRPNTSVLTDVDRDLEQNMKTLFSAISINNGNIDTSKVSATNITYNVTFEIIDQYNKVLANNGRTPTYIDRSYVENQMKASQYEFRADEVTGENFLVITKRINDSQQNPKAVIVLLESLTHMDQLLRNFLISTFTTFITTVIPLALIAFYVLRKVITQSADYTPSTISFNAQKELLIIENTQIKLPHDSYQYQLCNILFTKVPKNWSQEQLMELFHTDNWRIIYDAANAINKKALIKLIIYEDRNYFINPQLLKYIKKS